jgi:outer membrane immunogenic protein
MKKHLFLLAFAVSAILPATTALAADLEPPPPPVEQLRPATYDWSGGYVGGWVGNACIDGTLHDYTAAAALQLADYVNAGCGFKGGVLAGYNHQIDNVVLGIEADWGKSRNIVTNPYGTADYTFALNNIVTVRGRVGYAIDDTMLFLTAGGAWAQGDLDGIVNVIPDHIKANHYGWTIGGGVEHALTDTLRIKMDYLYTHMNTANYSTPCGVCDVDINWGGEHEVRLGAIWAF